MELLDPALIALIEQLANKRKKEKEEKERKGSPQQEFTRGTNPTATTIQFPYVVPDGVLQCPSIGCSVLWTKEGNALFYPSQCDRRETLGVCIYCQNAFVSKRVNNGEK